MQYVCGNRFRPWVIKQSEGWRATVCYEVVDFAQTDGHRGRTPMTIRGSLLAQRQSVVDNRGWCDGKYTAPVRSLVGWPWPATVSSWWLEDVVSRCSLQLSPVGEGVKVTSCRLAWRGGGRGTQICASNYPCPGGALWLAIRVHHDLPR